MQVNRRRTVLVHLSLRDILAALRAANPESLDLQAIPHDTKGCSMEMQGAQVLITCQLPETNVTPEHVREKGESRESFTLGDMA